ncbi:MAG: hypothetical protein V3U24_11060 [Candidatus Neomarinimicrobiota bacterium]
MKGDSFRFIPLACAAVFPWFFSALPGQVPDYDIGKWAGSKFSEKAGRFFQALTLQTSHHLFSRESSGDRLSLGGTVTMTSSFTHSDLRPISGKTGLLPVFEGNLPVTTNLSLNGAYTAFSSSGDVVIVYRYGMDLFLGGPWLVELQRGHLEGTDDFFLKTVGVAIVRQINYDKRNYWIGVGSGFYSAGVHIKNRLGDVTFPQRLEGDVTYLLAGLDRELGTHYAVDVEVKIHPSFLSLMVGVSRILH